MIKLIGFEITGHSLFEDHTRFSIQTAGQVTTSTKKRTIQFNNTLTLNRVIGIAGINATGKSTLLKIFNGLNSLYLADLSTDQTELQGSLRSNNNQIEVLAFLASDNNARYVVNTTFKKQATPTNMTSWIISDEAIYSSRTKNVTKSKYFDLLNTKPLLDRKELSDQSKKILSNKDSIFRAVLTSDDLSNNSGTVLSTVSMTDSNVFKTFSDQTPAELLTYLDPSIEFLTYENDSDGNTISYHLKFKDSDNVISVPKFDDIKKYLSSGTIKGITLFFEFMLALRSGATLLLDEIELHINKQIVRDFIGFFSNPDVNTNKATLIYSTHYIELTDDLKRKDEEYILTRSKQTKLIRLNNADVRTELKNSELFQNNTFRGTAPNYENYIALRNVIIEHNRQYGFNSLPHSNGGADHA